MRPNYFRQNVGWVVGILALWITSPVENLPFRTRRPVSARSECSLAWQWGPQPACGQDMTATERS